MSQSKPTAKPDPTKQATPRMARKAPISSTAEEQRQKRSKIANGHADSTKLALQAATVASLVKSFAQEYYHLQQSPQQAIDINHHIISGGTATLVHVCLLFAVHYAIEYLKARPEAVKLYREFGELSAQETSLSERLKDSS